MNQLNFYADAKAFDFNKITLVIYSDARFSINSFVLLKNGKKFKSIYPTKRSSLHMIYYYEFLLDEKLELGNLYTISLGTHVGEVNIDLSPLAQLATFDDLFAYDGDDLGANYDKKSTTFALWAPLANRVILKYAKHNSDNFHLVEMHRYDKGVYRIKIDGDLDGARYQYIVNNYGHVVEALDPYGKSSTANSQYSVVIDLKRLVAINTHRDKLPFFKSNCHAIIYEASVRDLTSFDGTDIVNKGKFLGLIEKNRRSKGGNKAGFDYLVSLGFTHLQLLPVQDFANVDELLPRHKYNWGYDPLQYFTIEGSYSTDPQDPYSRMREFKKMIGAFHKAGIRINLDVVYNHVFEVEYSLFEKIVPNYYFRRNSDGSRASHSGCGNDFASERKMARKLILDSIKFLLDVYDIDGLRFDLMGLIDVNTMKEVATLVKSIRPDAMLYGEGWNMGGKTFDNSPLATLENANLLPNYAFFNDRYRNIVKGLGQGTYLEENGFLFGNKNFLDGFKFVYTGSCIDQIYPRLFAKASQSINYVECHDNGTIFDVIDQTLPNETMEDKIGRLSLINKTILLSYGIPFFHMGQEIGLSKHFHTNTYNEGDFYNQFNYDIMDERIELVRYFKNYIKMRKELSFLRIDEPEIIDALIKYPPFSDGLQIDFQDELLHDFRAFKIFINPYHHVMYYDLKDDFNIYHPDYKNSDYIKVSNLMVAPLSALMLFKD